MQEFQTELDLVRIDYNKLLKTELSALFSAMKSTVFVLDMATKGVLSYFSHLFLPQSTLLGCMVLSSPRAFAAYFGQNMLYQSPPTLDYMEKLAQQLAIKQRTDNAIVVAAVTSKPDAKGECRSQVFIGYAIQGNACSRTLECSGIPEKHYSQVVNGVFGYLKMACEKYGLIKVKQDKGDN